MHGSGNVQPATLAIDSIVILGARARCQDQ
jgi:hypothetical protein